MYIVFPLHCLVACDSSLFTNLIKHLNNNHSMVKQTNFIIKYVGGKLSLPHLLIINKKG